jgi:hypothetical protein
VAAANCAIVVTEAGVPTLTSTLMLTWHHLIETQG